MTTSKKRKIRAAANKEALKKMSETEKIIDTMPMLCKPIEGPYTLEHYTIILEHLPNDNDNDFHTKRIYYEDKGTANSFWYRFKKLHPDFTEGDLSRWEWNCSTLAKINEDETYTMYIRAEYNKCTNADKYFIYEI